MISKIKNRKEVFAWSLYDFANQPFTTIIITFIYSAFFTKVIAENEQIGTTMWASSIALTAIIVAILSPILGAIADSGGYRKFFLILFTWVSAVFSILLYFPEAGDTLLALTLFVIANIAFEMGTVFCNSYLPDLSNSKNSGSISGFAWGLGFVGGLIALFLSLFLFPDLDAIGIRRINILVGVWFLVFSIPTILFVKDRKKEKFRKHHILDSFASIRKTFRTVSYYKTISQFLIARLFFNDGLVTIFALGGIYAVGTLDFTFNEVMQLGIVLNLAAGIGSFVFGYIEDKIGVKKIINISLFVLTFSTLLAFVAPYFLFQKEIFWVAGVLIGLMVGPNQSCSRSLMAQLTPKEKQNEFFGFFALTGKATSFLGPLLFGIVTSMYNQQMALWIIILLFVIGFILFNRIQFDSLSLQDEN
ncbi:MAG: MFS transporter [Flavobacteriales bacterium]|jgi:UMF1 family MFS transporter|nr:MFS transporter [Flavobacteriales bacterium]MDP7430057.1 MFS transporter [Flavobacteriales bacterium]HJN63618.1 MFS transporter [Flavobacteriales bacterium]